MEAENIIYTYTLKNSMQIIFIFTQWISHRELRMNALERRKISTFEWGLGVVYQLLPPPARWTPRVACCSTHPPAAVVCDTPGVENVQCVVLASPLRQKGMQYSVIHHTCRTLDRSSRGTRARTMARTSEGRAMSPHGSGRLDITTYLRTPQLLVSLCSWSQLTQTKA